MKYFVNSIIIVFLMAFVSSCGVAKSNNLKKENTASLASNSNQKNNKITENKTATNIAQPVEDIIKTKKSEIIVLEAKELTQTEKVRKAKDDGFVFTKNDEIVFLAKENIGIKYLTGGTTTKGMDCSGMVFTTFKRAEMLVPRSSRDLANFGVKIEKDDAVPGDLIFFKTNGKNVINHVGIITEIIDNDIKFVHASVQRGVIISSLSETYYAKAYAQINRVLN